MALLPPAYRKTIWTHRKGTRALQPAANTVLEGTLYYVTDESKLERSNGTAWEVYSSSGGGGGGGFVLLEQHTAAASASLNFTTWFSSTYDEYLIEFVGIKVVVDNTDFFMRMSTNGGVSYDASNLYRWTFVQNATTAFVGGVGDANVNAIKIVQAISNVITNSFNGSYRLYNPADAATYKFMHGQNTVTKADGNFFMDVGAGLYQNIAPINAFQFFLSAGNIASGTIRVYGIPK